MKKAKRTIIVVAFVICVHLAGYFFLLKPSMKPEAPSTDTTPPVVTPATPAQPTVPATPATPAQPTVPATPATPATPAQTGTVPNGSQVGAATAAATQPVLGQTGKRPAVQTKGGVAYGNIPLAYGPFVNDPGDLPKKLEDRIARECRSGILVDLQTRRILWQKAATTTYAVASMSKIMTAFELMCELKAPGSKNTLETRVQVPKKMFRKFSDCHIYMDPRESFTIDELLKCMMIHSANDCAYLLAEHIGGSEEAYVARMNARAQAMGLKSLNFCNSNGLPDRQNRRANKGNAMDMAYLAEYVLDVPEIMKWAGTRQEAIRENTETRKFALNNKNHLLGSTRCPGINGLKTGYIDDSKFCITVTCERQGRRMVCVVMGCEKAKTRDSLVVELLNWGYTVK